MNTIWVVSEMFTFSSWVDPINMNMPLAYAVLVFPEARIWVFNTLGGVHVCVYTFRNSMIIFTGIKGICFTDSRHIASQNTRNTTFLTFSLRISMLSHFQINIISLRMDNMELGCASLEKISEFWREFLMGLVARCYYTFIHYIVRAFLHSYPIFGQMRQFFCGQ